MTHWAPQELKSCEYAANIDVGATENQGRNRTTLSFVEVTLSFLMGSQMGEIVASVRNQQPR